MKRFINEFLAVFIAAVLAVLLSGCGSDLEIHEVTGSMGGSATVAETVTIETTKSTAEQIESEKVIETESVPTETTVVKTVTSETVQTTTEKVTETTETETERTNTKTAAAESFAPSETTSAKPKTTTEAEISAEKLSVEKDGSYTTPEDVAEYIHTFGTLPKNFITKSEAKALGWDNKKGNLWDVAKGKSIGGDHFGNYEGLLPEKKGRKYTECDVNYEGGYRGSERIIFSNDGLIYYTNDHYESFMQLY